MADKEKRIGYNKKTFSEIKEDMISMIREYYPDVINDFSDSNIGSLLIDLNAGVTNNLSMNTDRAFQETQLEYAQLRSSLLNHAKTFGFNLPNKRPSVTVVDYTFTIPVKGDKPDESYYPTISPNSQVIGGGKIFENREVIDFSQSTSNLGFSNRKIEPVIDANGIVRSYNVTKREVVFNGQTNIYKKVIKSSDVVPFFSIILPDPDVIEIQDIILIEGTNFSGNPSESDFNLHDNKFYEVDFLAEQRVFTEDNNSGTNSSTTGSTAIKVGKWIDVNKKFVKEFTGNGYCKITFGGGNGDKDALKDGLLKAGVTNQEFLANFLDNTSLGERLKKDHTLFVRYKTGGGVSSNIGTNSITGIGTMQINVNGSRQDFNSQIRRSLSVTNPIPAMGGNDGLSNEQIRNLIKYNFASQNRSIVIRDYLFQVFKMHGKYGSPFRANAFKENNKIVISILGLDSEGKLTNKSSSILKNNISEYLSKYRSFNDYIEIRDGRIFDLAFDVELLVGNESENKVANSVINQITSYFDINSHQMNEDIFISPLIEAINNVPNVINVISIKVYNKFGGEYSLNPIEQEIKDTTTGEINILNQTIYSTEDSLFFIRFPKKDIRIFLRKKSDLGR